MYLSSLLDLLKEEKTILFLFIFNNEDPPQDPAEDNKFPPKDLLPLVGLQRTLCP